MAAVIDEREGFSTLLQRLGFSPGVVRAIDENGFSLTSSLIGLDDKDIENLLKIVRNSTVPPTLVPFMAQKRLNTLCYWVNRRNRLRESISYQEFTPEALDAFTQLLQLDKQEEDSTQVKPPNEFKATTKWKVFKEASIAYFNSIRTKSQIPLAYVIREYDDHDPDAIFDNEHQRLIAVTPLRGFEYGEDNGKVFDYLKSWTLNGPAWTWMRNFNSTRNGRGAWLALIQHYEGEAQKDRVKDQAYTNILAAKYYGEKKKFSFETYVTIHQEAYEDLEQYGEHISEEKRVRDLLTGIKDPAANAAKQAILATPSLRNNFNNTVTHLATSLQLNLALQDTRNIGSTNTPGNRGGRGRGRGGGRQGGGRGGRGRGRNIYLGSYSPEQWQKLSADDKKRVREGRQKSAEQRSLPGQQTTNFPGGRTIATLGTDADAQSQSGLSIPTTVLTNTDAQLISTTNSDNKRSNPDTAGSSMSRRRLNRITSGQRMIKVNHTRNISHVNTNNQVVHGMCDLDSHADTCVAGPNCIVLEYTDSVTTVTAFSNELGTLQDIPIVTAATAYDNPQDGSTVILVLNQALYLGNKVENTLLCPNQLRHHGVDVDDVPIHLASPARPSTHAIYSSEDDFTLPLTLRGVISCFHSRTPTPHDLETCKWITLTGETSWNPHSDDFVNNETIAIERSYMPQPHLYDQRLICTLNTSDIINKTDLSQISDVFLETSITTLNISTTKTVNRMSRVTPEKLSQRWGIGIDAAQRTLKVTTQKGVRYTLGPPERRFKTKQAQLRFNQLSGRHGRFYTDTMFSSTPTISNKKMAQLYVNDLMYSKIYPMKHKSETADTLQALIHEVGIPHAIHSDDAKELMQGKFKTMCNDYSIPCTLSEPYSPWQNRAESGIRELKRHVSRKMKSRNVPMQLWDYCARWSCDVRSKTSSNLFTLDGRTPYEAVTGNTPDISSLIDYDFYEPVWYYDQIAQFPEPKRHIGRWLGQAYNIGQAMCYWILPISGIPIARSTVSPISLEDRMLEAVQQELVQYDQQIKEKLLIAQQNGVESPIDSPTDYDDDIITPEFEPIEEGTPDADEWDHEAYDHYISAEVILPSGDQNVIGKVIDRKRDLHGNPIGRSHSNPMLDTRIYEVEFPDGHCEEYSANVIAECLYSQVDNEGRQYLLFEEIIDWKTDTSALDESEKFQIGHNGNIHPRRTTKGWKLCVLWKDGSTSWETLASMKESFPVKVANFAIANNLQDCIAFKWWVPQTIKQTSRIIKAVKTRYIKKTHKYGIRLPKSIQEAYEIDKENGNDLWHQAILKEMKNNATAFHFLEPDENPPVGSKWIPFHMIFDIKIDLTRKARFVAGGHMTEAPTQLTYSSVVTRESVRIAFLIAALNELEVLSADIGNAYLQAPCREKVHTTAGPEFGPSRVGQTVIIVRAMYGLKSSGAAWHAQLSTTLCDMGFQTSKADPDVWFRAANKDNGYEYYEYILVYVDDILAISHLPKLIMETIRKAYRLKDEPSAPKTYLGATIKNWTIPQDQRIIWSMNSQHYIKEAIRILELELGKAGMRLIGKPNTPMQINYRPELDVSPLLGPEQANYYMSLIGILRWAVELGRIDIYVDVSMLSSHLAQPRIGHLHQVYHIFSYLKSHEQSNLVFDPNIVDWDESQFPTHDWEEFYKDVKESIPLNAPPSRGTAVQINAFVDADHAGDRVTRRSQTGIIIYLNCAPIIWYSKRQNTVESSTFGSEFVAMRIAVEMIESLRYKLRMFGIAIDGPTNVFCDNKSVVTNSTVPTSQLKKKHNSIAYHRVREAVAAKVIRIAKVNSKENLADLLTKPLGATDLKTMIQKICW